MLKAGISAWLAARVDEGEGAANLDVKVAAAGLLVAASYRGDLYTDVERGTVAAALMKLFHIGHPEAADMRQEAEIALADGVSFAELAAAAATLDAEDKEALVTRLWQAAQADELSSEEPAILSALRPHFAMTEAQFQLLRPRVSL